MTTLFIEHAPRVYIRSRARNEERARAADVISAAACKRARGERENYSRRCGPFRITWTDVERDVNLISPHASALFVKDAVMECFRKLACSDEISSGLFFAVRD